jgi:hypothetical protein
MVRSALEGGLTFASALRSFVRQDPDVIMVGAVRDSETAHVAIHAPVTGHQLSMQAPASFASFGEGKLRVLLSVSGQWQGAKS